ncbi:MAG: hypothetical protein AB7E79_16425 [Rhodospirillaceae bacterium]
MTTALAATMSLAAGCAAPEPTTSRAITLNDGRAGYQVTCGGDARGQKGCLVRASALCPADYVALGIGHMEMTIRCKGAAGE